MKYYSFNLVREKSKASKKNADDLENAISSAVGEVNNRLDGKAFVLISSIVSKGKRLRGVCRDNGLFHASRIPDYEGLRRAWNEL